MSSVWLHFPGRWNTVETQKEGSVGGQRAQLFYATVEGSTAGSYPTSAPF